MNKISLFSFISTLLIATEHSDVILSPIYIDTQYKLDELNRNMYFIDSTTIEEKGLNTTKKILESLPLVTLSNTGLGQNVDLRGQGSSANVNTQVLLNGIGLNMLDSSHGVTPFDSINSADIESVEILPGGGAVMYGNGTRGGVINIITKKRYERLSANLGLGYGYSNGSQAKLDAKIGGKIANQVYSSIYGQYLFSQGYRDKDLNHLGSIGGNVVWDINANHSLDFNLNYFGGLHSSTPVLRFSEIPNPSKKDRHKAGNGEITTLQERISTSLSYDYKINDSHKLKLKTFFHYYNLSYKDNLQIMDYTYRNFLLPKVRADQKGSSFLDSKVGFQARYDYQHTNGLFITGLDSIYNQGTRNLKFNIDWNGSTLITSYQHFMHAIVDAKKWSNSLYAIEKYDFTSAFSLTAGARYEFAWYGGKRSFENDMLINLEFPSPSPRPPRPPVTRPIASKYSLEKPISDLRHNFALELSPKYAFDFGESYFKYERGFRSPNPDNLTSRDGSGSQSNYIDTQVKSETYDTFELGSKFFVQDHAIFLLTGFYTLTHDEIYTIGSAHTGNGFKVGNYKLTHRTGIELASEQFFLDGMISLSESFTYIDARILDSGVSAIKNNSLIPYVSNYKATLGGNYRFYKGWNLWITSSFIGSQRDTAQNYIPAYNLTNIGIDFTYKNFSLSFGINNIADTFYYSFYNKDRQDEITGYAFLIGEGRSYFIEGRYKF